MGETVEESGAPETRGGPAERPPDAPKGRRARSSEGRSGPQSRPVLAALARFGLRAASHLTPGLTYRLGGALGWLYSFLPTRDGRIAHVNLKVCFPDASAAERRRLRRSSFAHTARYFLELGRLWSGAPEKLAEIPREVHGRDVLDRALEGGRGVLVLVPHLGCWEAVGLFLARHHPTTGLYRVPRVKEMDSVYLHGREGLGVRMVPAGASGVRAIQRALQRGEVACLLPDQDPGRGAGVFVPFFGHPANTGTLLSRLAARSRAAVVTGYARRGAGGRFDVIFGETEAEVADQDAVVGTAAVNRAVERCVREAPEQYLWSYKRFRYQPDRAPSPYRLHESGKLG